MTGDVPSDSVQGALPPALDPERWVEEHGDHLFGFAHFQLRDPAVAEDLVQDTFVAAWKARERFEGRSSERTWLTGILKNKIREHLRKKRRLVPLADLLPDDPHGERMFDRVGHSNPEFAPRDWGDDPAGAATRSEFRKALAECLAKLPDRSAEIFLAREVHGLSTDELATSHGLTPNNLWVVLHRCRQALRRCLEKNWFAP